MGEYEPCGTPYLIGTVKETCCYLQCNKCCKYFPTEHPCASSMCQAEKGWRLIRLCLTLMDSAGFQSWRVQRQDTEQYCQWVRAYKDECLHVSMWKHRPRESWQQGSTPGCCVRTTISSECVWLLITAFLKAFSHFKSRGRPVKVLGFINNGLYNHHSEYWVHFSSAWRNRV